MWKRSITDCLKPIDCVYDEHRVFETKRRELLVFQILEIPESSCFPFAEVGVYYFGDGVLNPKGLN